MWKLIRLLVYLAVLAGVALAAYAYLAPYFGIDFAAPQEEIRLPVTIDVE